MTPYILEKDDVAKWNLTLMCGAIPLIVFGFIVVTFLRTEIQCSDYKRYCNYDECFSQEMFHDSILSGMCDRTDVFTNHSDA